MECELGRWLYIYVMCKSSPSRCGRLLRTGVAEAAAVIAAPTPALAAFAEEQSAELRDRIFDEFNSLAVIFRAPAVTFVPPAPHAPLADDAAASSMVRAARAVTG